MYKSQFKTTINCGSCVRIVTPYLDDLHLTSWEVDTNNPDKILTVTSVENKDDQIIEAINEAGFDITVLR